MSYSALLGVVRTPPKVGVEPALRALITPLGMGDDVHVSVEAIPVVAAPLRPRRARATAVLAGFVAAGALVRLGISPWHIVVAVAVGVLVWVASIDAESRLLPDRIVLPTTAVVILACGIFDPKHALQHTLAAFAAAAAMFVAAAARRGALGIGDVKLTGLLGALLGRSIFLALLLGFCLVALPSLAILVREGRAGLKRQLPLGPFLAAGAVMALLLNGV